MSWPVKPLLVSTTVLACAAAVAGCAVSFGSQTISVPKSNAALYHGAVLFNQRCSGCHTLSYAATRGSAANVRTAQYNNGPNLDQRCERPVTRVLFAIENGGFSGAVMPQNVVVGQDAIDVAKFVSTYAGRKAPKVPGVTPCLKEAVGAIPKLSAAGTAAATAQAQGVSSQQSQAAGKSKPSSRKGQKNGSPTSPNAQTQGTK